MIGINISPNYRHFPYYACFDFESLLNKQNLPQNAQQLTYKARHVVFTCMFRHFVNTTQQWIFKIIIIYILLFTHSYSNRITEINQLN